MSVGGGTTPTTAPQAAPELPPRSPRSPNRPHRPPSLPHAITSQDGTITINIRQPEAAPRRPNTQHTGASSSLPHPSAPYTPSPSHIPQTHYARAGGGVRGPRPAREVFYSSDPNEEFVDSEMVSVFMDKKDLRKNYERAVYHGG